MLERVGELHSSAVISRHPVNPVLTASEVPCPAADTAICLVTAAVNDLVGLCLDSEGV